MDRIRQRNFWTQARQALSPPRFDDAIDNWRAVFLVFQVWVVVGVVILLLPVLFVQKPPSLPLFLPPFIVLPVMLCVFLLVRARRLAAASFTTLLIGMSVITAAMYFGKGIADSNYAFFILLIFTAGFLLGVRGALLFAGLGILTGGFFLTFPRSLAPVPDTSLILLRFSIVFVVVAVSIGLAYSILVNALVRARSEAESRRRSEENLRAIFSSSSDIAFIIADRSGGRITDASPSAEKLFGLKRDELLGGPMPFRGPSGPAGKGESGCEVELPRPGGARTTVIYSRFPIPGHEDGPDETLHVFVDITARKQAEEEKNKFEIQVLQSQKLESLGVLAGGIAHDFNNLLTSVIGNADLALDSLTRSSPACGNLTEIVKVANRASELCRQLLAYSGKGRFLVEPLDLNQVITEMSQMLEVSVSKKAVLRTNLRKGLPAIEADAVQIRQVLMNLIINASEALENHPGTILVSTGVKDCGPDYLDTTEPCKDLPPGTYVWVEVQDNGRGMDEATRARIFEPFFTTKFTGRGLGLAAVQGIVRGHKGAVKIYSEPGKGSAFKVFFPASPRSPADAAWSAESGTWRGQGTVLLVDDDPSVRSVSKSILGRLGFTCVEAADGEEAIRIFRERKGSIAVVVLDLTMPKMDGVETFAELRAIDRDVKVLLVSGYNEQEAVQQFSGKGLAGFLQKPYSIGGMATALRTIMEPR